MLRASAVLHGGSRWTAAVTGRTWGRAGSAATSRTFASAAGTPTNADDKQSHDDSATADFGFTKVDRNEKQHLVGEVFQSVASNYDIMNDMMSGGIHRLWKDHFISKLSPTRQMRLLDVAGGTGDIAFRFLEHPQSGEGTSVVVCDINPSMLQVGQQRARDKAYGDDDPGLSWVEGNAEKLPFEDASFDAYTIAFGIRNVTDIPAALSEAHRVLRPGGRFLCLEFSHLENDVLQKVYDAYSFNVIPKLGQTIAGDEKSYQYLVESIRKFPRQGDFEEMIRAAGFRAVSHENLTLGVTAIHQGFKL